MASHCSMSPDAVKTQLAISHSLSRQLDPIIPGCVMASFGAPISGHGTVTSDCDLCLLTTPTEQDRQILQEDVYFSSATLALWRSVVSEQRQGQKIALENKRAVSPLSELDASTSGESNTSLVSTGSTPPALPNQKTSVHFDLLLSFLRQNPTEYSKIYSIKNARCPIVQFLHLPSSLHCDISINNRYTIIYTSENCV